MRLIMQRIGSACLALTLALTGVNGVQTTQAASFSPVQQNNLAEQQINRLLIATPSNTTQTIATPAEAPRPTVELPVPSDQWLLNSVTDGKFNNTGATGTESAILKGPNAEVAATGGKVAVRLHGSAGATGEVDGYIKLPVKLSGTETDIFTISFWIKPEDSFTNLNPGVVNTVVLQGGRTMLNFIKAGATETELPMKCAVAGGSDLSVKAKVGKWQQVIFVRDAESKTVDVYINGSRALHQTSVAANAKDKTDYLNIGRHIKDFQMNGHYQGYISTVNHYTQAINEQEAAAIYEQEAPDFATQSEEPELAIEGSSSFTVADTGGTVEFGVTALNIEEGETVTVAFTDQTGEAVVNDNLTAEADPLLRGRTTVKVNVAAGLAAGTYRGTVGHGTAAVQFILKKNVLTDRVYAFERMADGKLLEADGTEEVGTLEGTAVLVPSDLDGNALFLDGTGYAVITEKIDFAQKPSTISVWVKPDESSFDVQAFTSARTLLHQKVSATEGRSILALRNNPEGAITSYMGGKNVNGAEDHLVIPGKWNQVAAALDPQAKKYRLFLNGRMIGEGVLGGKVVAGAADILIGKHREENRNLQFVGFVDNLIVNDGYLDETTVRNRYLEELPVNLLQAQIMDLADSWSLLKDETLAAAWVESINTMIENEVPPTQLAGANKSDCQTVLDKLSNAMVFYGAMKALRDDVVLQTKYLNQLEKALAESAEKPEKEMAALKAAITSAENLLTNVTLQNTLNEVGKAKAAIHEARMAIEARLTFGVVNVHSDAPVNTFTRALLGANHRFSTSNLHNPVAVNGYGSWDYINHRVYPQIKEYLSEMGLGNIRFPGGTCSNLYNWKRGIGPQEDRIPIIHGNALTGISSEFGVDEAARMCEEAGSEMVYVYNFANGSIQDALDLIEYLNAPNDGSNPGGGIDWASLRAANGHSEPYYVTKFEIGNEYYLDEQKYWTIGAGSQQRYAIGGEIEFQDDYKTIADKNRLSPYQPVEVADWTPGASVATGEANLVRYFRYLPVKEGSAHVFVDNAEWSIVESLQGQGNNKVCTVDYATGAITFGDGINGAIPQTRAKLRTKYTTIQPGFKDYGREMKAFGNLMGINIEVYSALHEAGFYAAMADDNDCWDGSAFHPYGNAGSQSGLDYHNAAMASADKQVMDVRNNLKTLHKYKPDGKLCITEYGILGQGSVYKDWLNSAGHGLYLVRSVMGLAEIDGVAYADRHSLLDTPGSKDSVGVGQMGILSCYESDDLKSVKGFTATPAALMLGMFNKFYGNTVVETAGAGIPTITTGSTDIAGAVIQATVDDAGYTYVAVGNCTQSEVPLLLTFDKPSVLPVAQVRLVASPKYNSVNNLTDPNLVRTQYKEIRGLLGEDSFLYVFPANSFAIIKLKTGDQLQDAAEVSSVSVSGATETEAGVRMMLEAEVFPENAYTRQVAWRITKGTDVAEIDAETGLVRTLTSGTFTVVAASGGVESERFEVTVRPEP